MYYYYSTGAELTVDVTIEELEFSDGVSQQPQQQRQQQSSQQQLQVQVEDPQCIHKRTKNSCYEEFRKQALERLSQRMTDPHISTSQKEKMMDETYNDLQRELQRAAVVQNYENILTDPNVSYEEKEKALGFTLEMLKTGRFKGIRLESLHFILTVTKPSALEDIWRKSSSGQLTEAFYNEFVTPQFMRKFDLKRITIVVGISETEYLRCKNALLARGE